VNEFTTGSSETQRFLNFGDFNFPVLADGTVNFPELGFISVVGLTVIELQSKLETLYSEFYHEPYVSLEVINNRVIVFPGSGGDAKVIPIENNNVTVIEAIAAAGGIAKRGNASRVKLIRRTFKETGDVESKVYLMDLSTIEGIQMANMTVQSNDIIYIEPVPELGREILQELQPIISIVSGMALIYTVFILRLQSSN
jgi:polysaccharide biosynthesis/export protein